MPLSPERLREWRKHNKLVNPFSYLLRNAKQRSGKYGIEFNLTLQDVMEAYPKDNRCPVFGTPFGSHEFAPSIDRIDNRKGYVRGNIQIISFKANTMKNSATKEELLAFSFWVQRFALFDK